MKINSWGGGWQWACRLEACTGSTLGCEV